MFSGWQKRFNFSILLGVIGLFIVAWGFSPYVEGIYSGLTNQKGNAPTPGQQADYVAVGQSGQAKTLAQGLPLAVATSSAPKNNAAILQFSASALPPKLPYVTPPFNPAAWIYDWGSASIASGTLDFGASTSTTGGDLFLASSSDWTNYQVQADVDWISGQSFGMVARLADNKDFVYCDFGNHAAQIVSRTNGDDTMVTQATTTGSGAGTEQNFGIAVFGNDIACLVNGKEILGAKATQGDPNEGGVGLISWDATPGLSRIAIKNFSVTALETNDIAVPFPVSAPIIAATTTLNISATETSTAAAPSTVPVPAKPAPPIRKLELPFSESDFTNDSNWQNTWGSMTINNSGFIEIESATDTSGGSVVLNNTDSWLNYEFDATVDWLKGETFMLIARYTNANNYVACNLVQDPNDPGAVEIELEEFVNGNEVTIQNGEDANFSHEGNTNIAIAFTVQGTQETCSFNGHTVSNAGGNLYGINPTAGGIGFSTWDPTLDNTEVIVRKISVTGD